MLLQHGTSSQKGVNWSFLRNYIVQHRDSELTVSAGMSQRLVVIATGRYVGPVVAQAHRIGHYNIGQNWRCRLTRPDNWSYEIAFCALVLDHAIAKPMHGTYRASCSGGAHADCSCR